MLKWAVAAVVLAFFCWAELLGGNQYTTIWLSEGLAVKAILFVLPVLTALAWYTTRHDERAWASSIGPSPRLTGFGKKSRRAIGCLGVGAFGVWFMLYSLEIIAQHLQGVSSSSLALVQDVAELVGPRVRCQESVDLLFAGGESGSICYWKRNGRSLTLDGSRLSRTQTVVVLLRTNAIGTVVIGIEPIGPD